MIQKQILIQYDSFPHPFEAKLYHIEVILFTIKLSGSLSLNFGNNIEG